MAHRAWRKTLVAFALGLFPSFGPVDRPNDTMIDREVLQQETFTDSRDGATYGQVQIGSQVWMAENLNYLTASGSWCYEDAESNCDTYGRLYDWRTATNACPDGWRLPSDEEWSTLEASLGPQPGTELKVDGTTGFDAKMAGVRLYSGSYVGLGESTHFWTSTSFGGDDADHSLERGLFRDQAFILRDGYGHVGGVSVRCLRD